MKKSAKKPNNPPKAEKKSAQPETGALATAKTDQAMRARKRVEASRKAALSKVVSRLSE